MVNVAGRSKGCAACRAAKIKCDLTLPECRRCVRQGSRCPGPRTGAYFVHMGSSPQHNLVPVPRLSTLQPFRAAAFDQLFVSYFIESFDQTRHVGAPGGRSAHWLDLLPAFLTGDNAPKFAIRAASMLSYGTAARDRSIQGDAYRWYARALPALRATLAGGRPPVMDGAVCSAVMLMHFETWAGTFRKAWIPHVEGVCTLLEAAGPQLCQVGFLHHVFCHVRLQSCVASMSENKLHSFASPEWMTVPFEQYPKTFFDELVDILFLVQKCLVHADQLICCNANDGRIWLDEELETWTHEAMALQHAWWLKLASVNRTDADGPSSTSSTMEVVPSPMSPVHFPVTPYASVSAAALTSLYHMVNILLLRLLQPCHGYDSRIRSHTRAILSANDFVLSVPGPPAEFGPVMMLLQLKMASLWGASSVERVAAQSVLQSRRMRDGGLMGVFDTGTGYFSGLATRVLSSWQSPT